LESEPRPTNKNEAGGWGRSVAHRLRGTGNHGRDLVAFDHVLRLACRIEPRAIDATFDVDDIAAVQGSELAAAHQADGARIGVFRIGALGVDDLPRLVAGFVVDFAPQPGVLVSVVVATVAGSLEHGSRGLLRRDRDESVADGALAFDGSFERFRI